MAEAISKPQPRAEMLDSLHCWCERFKFMYGNEDYNDVSFSVGETDTISIIKANRIVLSLRSEVFDRMFNGPWCPESDELIRVDDIGPETFEALIKYIYTDDVEITYVESAIDIFYAAKKYGIIRLEKLAIDFIERNVRADNVLAVMNVGPVFDNKKITKTCWEVIETSTLDVIKSVEFLSLTHDKVLAIVKSDELATDEVELFQRVLNWGEAELKRKEMDVNDANIRAVLNDIVHEIRFPAMDY